MKQVLFILLLLKTITLIAQQSEIKGIISIHNSEYETGKRQYVANAQVEDDFKKATAQTTDANGNFKLVFVRIPEKTSVQLIVKKEDLQVVNIDGLSAVTGQRDLVRLSMAKPDKIAEYRRQIYQVGKTEAEKNLAAQLKKKGEQITTLQKDVVKNKTAIERLQKEYAELQAFASKIEEQAQDLARRYAPINLDDAAPLYRESFRLFQQGELGQALQILRGAGLIKQANNIFAERKNIQNIRNEADHRDSIQDQRTKDLMQVLGLKADLHKARFEWDSVLFCLELRVNLDSTNVHKIWSLADFLAKQNQIHEAIYYYEKALSFAKTSELEAAFLHNLGTQYFTNGMMTQSEATYENALKIYRQLAEKNPDAFLPDVAMTLTNLGNYYHGNQKTTQSEVAYEEALKTYRQLVEKNPELFLPDLATALTNRGNYYHDNQKIPQAETVYNEAMKIYRQLADNNPDAFLPHVATILNNLGGLYYRNQKMLQADSVYAEALSINRQLAEDNPDAFLPDLAMTLNNFGAFLTGKGKFAQADSIYAEALKIYRQLVEKNPDAFLPDLAMILNNLGVFYRRNQQIRQAELVYAEALKIRRQLVEKNLNAFLPDLAMTLNNLGVFYSDYKKMEQAEALYTEALKIFRQLADKNTNGFLPWVAIILNNLGVFYETLTQYKQALNYFGEAKAIQEKIILGGSNHQFKNWKKIIQNISIVKDSAKLKKEFGIVAKAGQLLAEGYDTLKGINVNEQLLPYAVKEYISLSWWALLAKDYSLSEKAALRCLELDNTQEWVLTNLGHSQLLRGHYAVAKATYARLKGKKDSEGKDYKQVLLDDLNALEAEGITHKDFAQARAAIEKW